jgi:hypothetical protein
MAYRADPITMQVIRYAMEQVADEMGNRGYHLRRVRQIWQHRGPGPPCAHAADRF